MERGVWDGMIQYPAIVTVGATRRGMRSLLTDSNGPQSSDWEMWLDEEDRFLLATEGRLAGK